MKIKVIILSLISSMAMGGVFAQDIEFDDMYFNSKDRAKLREAQKADELAFASVKKNNEDEEEINPTDSYSARNVNPEFTSRSQSETAQADEEDYFVNNYQYNQSRFNNWNNSYNNWYSNPWYTSNFWGPAINSWSSPYYGFYDPWSSPWYDPYWSYNGWSSSFSFYYGNSWNYGWGGNYNYWNRPYCGIGLNSFYASNVYWSNYRYPIFIVNNNGEYNGRNVSYGKRPTRGSSVVLHNNNHSRSRSGIIRSDSRGDASGGRVADNGRTQTQYYDRSWRNSETRTVPSQDSRRSTQNNRPSTWTNSRSSNNNSWNNSRSWSNSSNNRSSNSTYTPSRSSSSFSSGTRSHSSSSGSGSNGRSRGRD